MGKGRNFEGKNPQFFKEFYLKKVHIKIKVLAAALKRISSLEMLYPLT